MELNAGQKERLDMLMDLDVEWHQMRAADIADSRALRNEQREWRKTELRFRAATLALVVAEVLVVAWIAWAVST